jgi:hypothetical protein
MIRSAPQLACQPLARFAKCAPTRGASPASAALDAGIDARTWYEIWVAGNGAPAP